MIPRYVIEKYKGMGKGTSRDSGVTSENEP